MKNPSSGRSAIKTHITKIATADFQIAGFQSGSALQLAEHEAHIWHIDLNESADAEFRWHEFLSADEKERAVRFHFERDRKNFSATRGLLRIVLAQYLGKSPQEITFCYAEKGKPALAKALYDNGNIQFNVSHSGEAALFGFTRKKQIGVDIEHIRRDVEIRTIARRFFSAQEQAELTTFPEAQQIQLFFRIWTLKESFIKALGEGLSHPLDQFDVSVDPNSPPTLSTRPNAFDAQRWHLQVLDAGADYAAAFAVAQR